MEHKIYDIRADFKATGFIEESQLPASPMELFEKWFAEILETVQIEPAAMTFCNNGSNGFPQSRMVLLKKFSDDGLVFFSNYKSQKGIALSMDNKASALFYWSELGRQVRFVGEVEKISNIDSDDYFYSRPLESRISAVVSPQSEKIASRNYLTELIEKYRETHSEAEIKRPSHWGGYILKPLLVEFWQAQENRLHDRIVYRYKGNKWETYRLAP